MTAYRNDDPPDYPDLPECCDDEMECFEDGVCLCPHCGLRLAPAPEWDPGPECFIDLPDDFMDGFEGPEECPHGNKWGACDHCDFLSDLAYDAAREKR